jgi:O-antigen/teichoic acid export membrane protein
MFSSGELWVVLLGVFTGLGFIIAGVVYVNKLFIHETKDVLVRFILMIFAAMVGIFIVDKVIAFKIKLLTDEMNNQLFDLIKTLILMIFSYYFGTQKNNKVED